MKKFTCILVALFAATFANAQITLEHTTSFPLDQRNITFPNLDGHESSSFNILGDLLLLRDRNTGEESILDLQTYSTIVLPDVPSNGERWYIAKGYFTTDSRICYLVWTATESLKNTDDYEHLYLYDVSGTLIQDFGGGRYINCGYILLHDGKYKFYIGRSHMDDTTDLEIYSLPGNGEAGTDIVSPSSAKRSARKIARDGQVLIETETNTYTLQGAEVK